MKKIKKVELDLTAGQKEWFEEKFRQAEHLWNRLVEASHHPDFNLGDTSEIRKEWKSEHGGWIGYRGQIFIQIARDRFTEAYEDYLQGIKGPPRYKGPDQNPIRSVKNQMAGPTKTKPREVARLMPGTYTSIPFRGSMSLPTKHLLYIEPDETATQDSPAYVRIKKEKDGKWFATIVIGKERDVSGGRSPGPRNWVGIDPGLNATVTLSDGRMFHASGFASDREKKRQRTLQRSLSRKEEGSSNWQDKKQELAKLRKRIRRRRDDALHKLSRKIVEYIDGKDYDAIGWEGTDIASMMSEDTPEGMKDQISDQAWNELMRKVEYKAAENGIVFQQVNIERFPSSKLCHACGEIHEVNEVGDYGRYECFHCDNEQCRDVNAARNIRDAAALLHGKDDLDNIEADWLARRLAKLRKGI